MIEFSGGAQELRMAGRNLQSIQRLIPKAYSAALGRVSQRVRTEGSRQVREKYHIKTKDVNNKVRVKRQTGANASVELRWSGGNTPIIKFRTTPSKVPDKRPRVLKAAIKKSGLKPIRGAFVAKVGRGGHVGVFKRVGKKRFPIQEVFGPAVPVLLNEHGIVEHLKQVAHDTMEDRLNHEILRALEKAGERR
ncbi:phage tail protein [Paenibacillus sp. CGMCC 1.16610]|uniref:Phage tail protein n=1 Tax=Paenibacillus anseongense TaxID=2682845 RepID=A0ABW9U2M7_9BACL|nr:MULTISPECIES: phage tail protein [Paenibacillus]MBA2943209.1 phage tail protein [Paenibacillus sp. CGMCC 1.16610]MVQ33706.1 hypothetical protein [Paenibacillus anseongense]